MANWASTSYAIEGSKEDINKLYAVIDDFMMQRRKPVTDIASIDWEGNICKALGATEEQMNNYLRGFIQSYEIDGDVLRIEAEEAWGATDFRHVLAELIPDLTIYYIVEEPGCEVYATNDTDGKYFSDRYNVDAFVNGRYYDEYFSEESEAMKYVAEFLGRKQITMKEIEAWNEEQEDEDNFINVHAFEIVA